jgi:hypothetical protein
VETCLDVFVRGSVAVGLDVHGSKVVHGWVFSRRGETVYQLAA